MKTTSRSRRAWQDIALQVGAVVLFLLAWQWFSTSQMAHQADMPGPIESFTRFFTLFGEAQFWSSLGYTLLTWAIALIISFGIGVPVGLALGRNRVAFDSGKFLIDFLRTLPSVALIPLTLLLFGASVTMAVVIGVLSAVWPLIVQSTYAGQHADVVLHRVSRSFRLTAFDRIRYVLAPDALAFIWPGLRIAITASLLSTVGAQLIGGAPGIGLEILQAQNSNQSVTLYAYIIAASFLGLAINSLFGLLQRKLLWWHPSMRGAR